MSNDDQQDIPTQMALPVQLVDQASFDSYYVPEHSSVQILLQSLRQADTFQWYVWGGEGFGVSRLLQGACTHFSEKGLSARYIPLKDLVGSCSADSLLGLEEHGFLSIDDLDVIAGHSDWQERLFNLYNRCLASNCHLFFGAKQPPSRLGLSLADLHSRLNAGAVYELPLLSDDDREQALLLRARLRGFHLDPSVIQYILRNFPRNNRALFSLLESLDMLSLQEKRRVTIPLIKKLQR